jgi:hypothetical protein
MYKQSSTEMDYLIPASDAIKGEAFNNLVDGGCVKCDSFTLV